MIVMMKAAIKYCRPTNSTSTYIEALFITMNVTDIARYLIAWDVTMPGSLFWKVQIFCSVKLVR